MATAKLIQRGKNFEVYEADGQKLIKLMNVRASYPHFGAKARNEDEESGKVRESWNGVAMLPKSTHAEAYKAVMAIIDEIKANAVNEKTGKKGVNVDPANICLKDGDNKDDENMHGHWLVNFADANRQPAIRDARGDLILDTAAIDKLFYGGCWINVMIRPWYFNGKAKNDPKTYPKRISCGFTGAQFVKNDTPFGAGRIDDGDAWGAVEGADEDSDDGL